METESLSRSLVLAAAGEAEAVAKVSMANFELLRVLGKGAYGKVFLVRKLDGPDHGRIYAMKVLRKSRVLQKPKTLEHTIAERQVLEHIRSAPFLVSLHYAFQTDTKLHLVLDYISGGELFTRLCASGHFVIDTTRFYIAELIVALDNLHKIGIIYRDLKLENVMLDQEGHVILTDFGLSKEFEENDPMRRTNSYCGTIEYMAPEVVKRREEGYTYTADWWSLGVLTFELLTGCSPFTVEGAKNSSREIAERILTKKVPFPRGMNPGAKDFIDKMVNKTASRRLGASGVDEIKRHAFFLGLDWDRVQRRELTPPFLPPLSHPLDVANFADEFTKQNPVYSPADTPDSGHAKTLFRGYSFVSPSVMLSSGNAISSDYLNAPQSLPDHQALPLDIQKFGEDQDSAFFKKYDLDLSDSGFLGIGAFSVCRVCRAKDGGAEFAVKVISQRYGKVARREESILRECQDNPNIVKLVEMLSDSFHVYLVMELLRGPELLTRIRNSSSFTEAEAARITRRLISAVVYLHSKGVVHRDLKPENIIFESGAKDSNLRLVDFGFARRLGSAGHPLTTPCYTLHYAAPEVLHKNPLAGPELEDWLPQYNQQCDLWSLGVILFTMLSGHVPFHAQKNESASDIMARIRKADFSLDGPEWAAVSKEAKNLIEGLLTVDPAERLTAEQVSDHTWLRFKNSPQTPLATPTILGASSGQAFNETLSAFLTANKEGFHLADVSAAPLAQRRRGLASSKTSAGPSLDGSASSGKESSPSPRRSSESSDPKTASASSRKRKLYPVPEEATSQEEEMATTPADEGKKLQKKGSLVLRPTSLGVASPDRDDAAFSQFREAPGSRRQTHEPSTDQPPPPPTTTNTNGDE